MMKNYIFFCFSLLFVTGCKIIDPVEKTPAYVYISTFNLVDSSYSYHGSTRNKIKDGWVYVNDEYLGTFELPVKIPILAEGSTQITISPGVLTNGITGTRTIYPGYRPFATTKNLIPLKIDTIQPRTFYNSYLKFVLSEDFELSNAFENLFNADTSFYLDTITPFEGRRSLAWTTSDSFPTVNFENKTDLVILGGGRASFMELDYKCNVPFSIYLDVTSAGGFTPYQFFVVNPKENWNKIYLNLSPAIAELPADAKIRLRFYSVHTETGKQSWGEIDNVKIFYVDN
jgi:hypothetical protein